MPMARLIQVQIRTAIAKSDQRTVVKNTVLRKIQIIAAIIEANPAILRSKCVGSLANVRMGKSPSSDGESDGLSSL